MSSRRESTVPGWDRLSHHGLLLDVSRLQHLAKFTPEPLGDYTTQQLRLRAGSVLDDSADRSVFITFVLEQVCGLDAGTGTWLRGSGVPSSERRRTITGETIKPNHLWKGIRDARLPVFIDDSKRLGLGRSRRLVSQAIGYLRAGNEHLALLTNGRHWRLLFAGLDYEAWCDWDIDLWFEEGELSDQVAALRTLVNAKVWRPDTEGATPALLQAIRDTRKGQAELSEVLGERVREAVEILIRSHGDALAGLATTEGDNPSPGEIYRAGCRVAMRLVVILFAESRELLPRENALYHGSYGLNGLFEQLERDAAQGRAMRESYAAWPRVLALFRLVREGSHHPDLPVTKYGGELFAPGESDEPDGLSQALAVFENACLGSNVLPDTDVHEMLKLLTRTTMRIRQGRASTRTAVPVDFTDLSSEYIGILYEGLLDYELKTAPVDDPVVFIATGDQPAMPLSRLEAMDTNALKALFASLKDGSSDSAEQVQEADETKAPEPAVRLPIDEAADVRGTYAASGDERQQHRERAERWARDAVQGAGLVNKRGKDTPERQLRLRAEVGRKARQLVARVVLPGEWYLVRWGGTRKGSGSFYTRPGLTIPTVQRTLRPLAYDPPKRSDGTSNTAAPATQWTPKQPERILELTVCDPACGSGSFPLAALRFLTDAVYAALQYHERIEKAPADRSLVRLLGVHNDGHESLGEELIPCPPDDERFEGLTKAVLRRYVVERCIYAVDIDPLAVELCRLSLWIETMDKSLPFGFLDHKIKCGNSLIGAWFDEFAHYPAMAWKNREGGDKSHSNGVHFEKNARTKAIKAFVNETVAPELKLVLQGRDLFQTDALALATATHAQAMSVINDMHALPVQDADERARLYRDELLGSDAWSSLKGAMDLWCACWFWPAHEIGAAPTPQAYTSPGNETRTVAQRVASEMRFFHWELEFPDVFQQTTSDVGPAGFDAILGNPPWDIAKPVSKEFFSNIDPLYRSYGKQEALRRQKGYFDDDAIESDWLDYNARFRAQSNYMSHAGNPSGDPAKSEKSQARFSVARGPTNDELHERWRHVRDQGTGFADPAHPYRHQGSADLNLYKLFLEKAHGLLSPQGRLGFLVPSGLYSDHGTGALRSLFLEHCRWEWLFGVENRDGIFPIHRSYKFNPIIVQKGGKTDAINTAFMRRKLEDWERAEAIATPYSRKQVERFSPKSRAILEIQSARDLEILEKIYANGVLLGDDGPDGWGITYTREFDMTNDSHLFPPRPEWEAKGYRPDEYSRWLLGDWRPMEELWEMLGVDPTKPEPAEIELEDWLFDTTAGPERREAEARFVHGHLLKPGDVARTDWKLRCAQPPYDRLPVARVRIPAGIVLSREGDAWIREEDVEDSALPLMQGAMLHQFDFSQKGWVSGTGLQARWEPISWGNKHVNPQFLMSSQDAGSEITKITKVAFRRVARNTDARTMIASVVPQMPCGDKASVLRTRPADVPALALVLNSVALDALIRLRVGGTQVDYHYARETPLLPLENIRASQFPELGLGLNCASQLAAAAWCHFPELSVVGPWKAAWAITDAARLNLRVLADVLVSFRFGLSVTDLRDILASCDRPDPAGDVKGFWRVDKDKPAELRQTVLTLVAFNELQSEIRATGDAGHGLEAFQAQNCSESWLPPEHLCLADHQLGHDQTARQSQPVASRLGPRFCDWQLAQTTHESWRECHVHGRNLLGGQAYAHLVLDALARLAADVHAAKPVNDQIADAPLVEDAIVATLDRLASEGGLDQDVLAATVEHLHDGRRLSDSKYEAVLATLRRTGTLDEANHGHRLPYRQDTAPTPQSDRAEPRAGHKVPAMQQGEQSRLFD